jgi:glycosyltransferase involved in cell wall biosynthesis
MRILYTNIGWRPASGLGGPIISVAAAAERLVQRGHEVTVFTTNAGINDKQGIPLDQPVDVEGVKVWYFRRLEIINQFLPFLPYMSDSMGFAYAPRIRAELDRLVPLVDCVDTQSPFIYPALAAARAAIRFNKPLFYHQRGNLLSSHLQRRTFKKKLFIKLFEQRSLVSATTVIALNEAERCAYARFAPETHCEIVPNGIDMPAELDRNGAAARLLISLGIPTDAQVILYLGRVHPWKRVQVLLDAFLRMASQFPRAVMVIAGPEGEWLQAKWAAMDRGGVAHDRVVFTGSVYGDFKRDLLDRADLFSLPSCGEGLSMALLEAMSHAVPVIISPECNFSEVETANAGRVIDANAYQMADAMSAMLADDGARLSAGLFARKFASNYSWDPIIDRLIEVYTEGIERNRRKVSGRRRLRS